MPPETRRRECLYDKNYHWYKYIDKCKYIYKECKGTNTNNNIKNCKYHIMNGWSNSIKTANTNTTTKSYIRHLLKVKIQFRSTLI